MASKFRQAARAVNAAADAVTRLLDGGELRIYSGPQPGGPDASVPPSAVLLVACGFADPAFRPARNGIAEAKDLESGQAVASGPPTWFRAVTATGLAVYDGSAGLESDRPDLVMGVTTIVAGAEVVVTGLSYELPARA